MVAHDDFQFNIGNDVPQLFNQSEHSDLIRNLILKQSVEILISKLNFLASETTTTVRKHEFIFISSSCMVVTKFSVRILKDAWKFNVKYKVQECSFYLLL